MTIPQKLDKTTATALRSILSSLNISKQRVIIDLNNDTLEIEEDYNVDDLLKWSGCLTKEQAAELQRQIRENRDEDWD